MKKHKAAVVGAGFMGTTHAEALRRIGVEVVGLIGTDPQESARTCEKLLLPCAFNSFEEILEEPQVDVVHICTPNYLHYPMVKAALLAGKHIICEKPLTMTSAEARELVEIVHHERLVGVVNYNLRYYPLCQEARARVRSGQIGDVRLLHGEYCQDWLFLPTDWNWRLVKALGGDLRVVADIGTHWMDMVTWITDLDITEVMADFATFIPIRKKPLKEADTFSGKLVVAHESEDIEIDTEDYASVLLKFINGVRGSMTVSQISAGRKNNFWWEINGTSASLYWRQESPNEMWIGYREKPNELLLKDPALFQPESRLYAAYPGGHAEGYPDTFARLFSDVYSYLSVGNLDAPAPFPTFKDGLKEIILCEAIQKSAVEKRWVNVEFNTVQYN